MGTGGLRSSEWVSLFGLLPEWRTTSTKRPLHCVCTLIACRKTFMCHKYEHCGGGRQGGRRGASICGHSSDDLSAECLVHVNHLRVVFETPGAGVLNSVPAEATSGQAN